MANKKFTKHAQRVLNHNPNVVKCTEGKIIFTEEFIQKVVEALKAGNDPYQVFEDNGISVRVLGKSRVSGAIGLWKSRYELENLPRRKPAVKEKKPVETAAERRAKNLANAISYCDSHDQALVGDKTMPKPFGLLLSKRLSIRRRKSLSRTYAPTTDILTPSTTLIFRARNQRTNSSTFSIPISVSVLRLC